MQAVTPIARHSVAKELLKNIEYYMNNNDAVGLAQDLSILLQEVAVNNDCEHVLETIADVLADNHHELVSMD